jgi:hypothetical protein
MTFNSSFLSAVSLSNASQMCLAPQPPQAAPEPPKQEESTVDRVLGAVGLGADSGEKLADAAAKVYHEDAAFFGPATDLGGALQEAGESAEKLSHNLGVGGKILSAIDVAGAAHKAYDESTSDSQAGKVMDAAIAGGSKALTAVSLPVSAVDYFTGNSVSGLFRGGGEAIASMPGIAQGDLSRANRYEAAVSSGAYGPVAQALNNASVSVTQGLMELPETLRNAKNLSFSDFADW